MGSVFRFLFGPRGGWPGLLPVNPFTFSFPFGGSEVGGGGWTGANVRFHLPPPSPIAYVQPSRFAICVYVHACMFFFASAFMSTTQWLNTTRGGMKHIPYMFSFS